MDAKDAMRKLRGPEAVGVLDIFPQNMTTEPNFNDALAIFAVVFVTHTIGAVYRWYTTKDLRHEQALLTQELLPLEQKIKLLEGNMDYFVPLSKLQRQANVLQEKLKRVNRELGEAVPQSGALGLLEKVLHYANPKKWKAQAKSKMVHILCGLFIVYRWWGVPLLLFPDNWFWPFGFVLAKPWHSSGAVGALGWYIVCTTAVPRITSTVYGVVGG